MTTAEKLVRVNEQVERHPYAGVDHNSHWEVAWLLALMDLGWLADEELRAASRVIPITASRPGPALWSYHELSHVTTPADRIAYSRNGLASNIPIVVIDEIGDQDPALLEELTKAIADGRQKHPGFNVGTYIGTPYELPNTQLALNSASHQINVHDDGSVTENEVNGG